MRKIKEKQREKKKKNGKIRKKEKREKNRSGGEKMEKSREGVRDPCLRENDTRGWEGPWKNEQLEEREKRTN